MPSIFQTLPYARFLYASTSLNFGIKGGKNEDDEDDIPHWLIMLILTYHGSKRELYTGLQQTRFGANRTIRIFREI